MRILKIFQKSEKGSITLMVLASMMFVLVVITASYFAISNKSMEQDKKISQIVKQYQESDEELRQQYMNVYNSVDYTNGLGDVNSDGNINQEDVDLINAYLEGTNVLSDEQKLRADINKDEQITNDDSESLKEYLDNKSAEV